MRSLFSFLSVLFCVLFLGSSYAFGEQLPTSSWQTYSLGTVTYSLPSNWQEGGNSDTSRVYIAADASATLIVSAGQSPPGFDKTFTIRYYGFDGGSITVPGNGPGQMTIGYPGILMSNFKQEIANRTVEVCVLKVKQFDGLMLTNTSFSLINSEKNYCFSLLSANAANQQQLLSQIIDRISDQYQESLKQSAVDLPKVEKPLAQLPEITSLVTGEQKAINIARAICIKNGDSFYNETYTEIFEIGDYVVTRHTKEDTYEVMPAKQSFNNVIGEWALISSFPLNKNGEGFCNGFFCLYRNTSLNTWLLVACDEGVGISQEDLKGVPLDVIQKLGISSTEEFFEEEF